MKKMKSNVKYVAIGALIIVLTIVFTFANYESANAAAGREDPLVGFSYALDIQGMVTGYFTEASNIGSEHEIVEHKVMGQGGKQVVMKIPGRLKFSDVTLKRGITKNIDLAKWRQMVVDGQVDSARRDGSILMFDRNLKEVARWNFLRAWPSKFICNPVDASGMNPSGVVGIESVTITFEWIQRVK